MLQTIFSDASVMEMVVFSLKKVALQGIPKCLSNKKSNVCQMLDGRRSVDKQLS